MNAWITAFFFFLAPRVICAGELPKQIDQDLWFTPGSLRLYFDVSGIQAREGYQLFVLDAKIRLFKYQEVR